MPRGRPRLYFTEEDKKTATKETNRAAAKRYRASLRKQETDVSAELKKQLEENVRLKLQKMLLEKEIATLRDILLNSDAKNNASASTVAVKSKAKK